MYNYYTEQIIVIDTALLAAAVLLSLVIIFYIFFRDYADKKYKRKLWEIKKNVYALAVSGIKLDTKACPAFVNSAMPRDLLDVEMNRARDAVFFNSGEQEIFRECFAAAADKIKKAERDALCRHNKWRKIEAILCLGYLREKTALDIFKKTILDKDEDVSYFTMMSLGRVKTAGSARILIDFFKKK